MSRLTGRGGNETGGSVGIESFVPVVSTTAGLPANPKNGSQVLFLPATGRGVVLTYDALKGKWVGPETQMASWDASFNASNSVLSLFVSYLGVIPNYKTYYDAGLRLEAAMTFSCNNASATQTGQLRAGIGEFNDTEAVGTATGQALGYIEKTGFSVTGATTGLFVVDWSALSTPSAPAKAHANWSVMALSSAGSSLNYGSIRIRGRWTN